MADPMLKTPNKKKMERQHSEESEEPPIPYNFTKMDLFLMIFSLLTYLADIGSDLVMALIHLFNGDINWFLLTLLFVFLPSLLLSAYLLGKCCKKCSVEVTVHLVAVAIPGGFIYFFIAHMIKGVRSMKQKDPRKKQKLLKELVSAVSVSAYYRLFEAFLEAAPQLVLQLYVKFNSPPNPSTSMVVVQTASVVTSLASLAWAIASHYKIDRLKTLGEKVPLCGVICIFLWRLFTVAARVLAIALFASFKAGGLIFILFHFMIMLFWVKAQCSCKSCSCKCKDCFDGSILKAFVLIFCCLNLPKQGHTRLEYVLYYTLVYIENVGMLFAWFLLKQPQLHVWLKYAAFSVIMGGFFIGIFFQVIYYLVFHPNNHGENPEHPAIKKCVPCSDLGVLLRNLSESEIANIEQEMAPFVTELSQEEVGKCKAELVKKLQKFRGGELKAKTKEIVPLYFSKLKLETLQSV